MTSPDAERAATAPGLGKRLISLWRTWHGRPFGPAIFSWMVGRMAPYSGTMGARVETLKPGFARLVLRDRRRVRNHLGSIHAIALANLGELTSGLALMSALPDGMRGILVGFSIEYLKKARGTLRAESAAPIPADGVVRDYGVHVVIQDGEGDAVARGIARWRIAPVK